MASYTISPIWGAGAQLFDNSGNVLTGGKIYTYFAGTTTPLTTYTDPLGSTANSNPIVANAAGRLTNEIWFPVSGSYKFVLKDASDALIATYDNIPTTPQPPIVNDASSISYDTGYIVNAGNFTIGETYRIDTVGTTDFIAIGASGNVNGILFTASGVGSGTGTAEYVRTVENKLRETVSVKDFGAVGDGVTDDAAAIQAAIDAVNGNGGGSIYFPAGVYFITSGIAAKNNVTLFGDKGSSEILLEQDATAQILYNPNQTTLTTVDDFSIVNLIFNSNTSGNQNGGYSAVAVNGCKRFTAKGCVFKNASGYGLAFQANAEHPTIKGPQEDIWIEDCEIYNNGFNVGAGGTYDGFDVKATTRMFVKNCISYDNAQKGFNFRGDNVTVDGLVAYSNGQEGISVGGGGTGAPLTTINLSNIHAYSNTLDGISIATSEALLTGRQRVNIVNVNSHNNTRSGIRIYENNAFPVYGEFEITISNSICWSNGVSGIDNEVATIKALVVSSSVFKENARSGITNIASNCVFTGCHCLANGAYGYEGASGQSGNQYVGGVISGNTNTVRFTETVSVIGVQGVNALFVQDVPNSANYWNVKGATSGNAPRIAAAGSDTNIDVYYSTKGTGQHAFYTNSVGAVAFVVDSGSDATSDSWLEVRSSTSGNPVVRGAGTATDVDISLQPKGSGLVRFGTRSALSGETVSGYITIKDINGTTRKIAVVS